MFLKSMELMGFKSFADRTHIDFSSGISALLGPNGCGKSNIVDAVKWVLGEQSTKNMRAMKMEDVIFNGTVKRKALNVAEVTLTISNETNILDLDAPEIEIKRRLYRSGDSEYFINNTSVRLKELRELFFDTGIGKTAYSILEQGKIDQILSNRPEERRYLFEEAAGITKFKQKGLEAERKLEKTRENIKQVKNILTEVSKNYFLLKEQSEKTLQYRKVREELFNLEVNLQLLRINKLKELHKRRDEEHSKRKESLEGIQKDIEQLNNDLSKSNKESEGLTKDLDQFQKNIYQKEVERDSFKGKVTELKEREIELQAKVKSLEDRESKYNQRIDTLKKDSKAKENDVQNNSTLLEKLDKQLTKYIEEGSELSLKVEGLEKDIEENNKSVEVKEDRKLLIIEEIKDLATKITDKLQNASNNFSKDKHTTLVELFRGKLKKALTNPSILYNLESDFNEVLESFPVDILNILAGDADLGKKKDLDKEFEELTTQIKESKDNITKFRDYIKQHNHRIDVNNELISKEKVKIAETKVKISSIEESLQVLKKSLVEEESLISDSRKEKIQTSEKLKQLVLDREKLQLDIQEIEKNNKVNKSKIENLEKEINKLKGDNSHKLNELSKKRDKLSNINLQIERYNFESEHLESKVSELFEEFRERFSIELSEAETSLEEYIDNEDVLKEKVTELKIRQKMIGQINLMAPEEFKEVSKRYNFLNDQINDLQEADKSLSKVTEEIKHESTRLFTETFHNIRKSFSVMYQRLFGGGMAELKLTDASDILESGIEIFAKPPGKSLENISLLSGGERSLTAVALLFATYSIKPSPFCILDEIDAALDERNISRFVTTLTEFAKESQFIVITHNKKTVTGAEALLGVTMQESGVSKLITMRLDNEEKEE